MKFRNIVTGTVVQVSTKFHGLAEMLIRSDQYEYLDANWVESDHPRDENGRFSTAGGGGGGGEAPGGAAPSEAPSPPKAAKTPGIKSNDKFVGGGRDKYGYDRSPRLKPEHRKIEQRFYNRIRKYEQVLLADYWKAQKGKKYTRVIDPDLVKEMDPDFAKDPGLSGAVHEPSSYLAKRLLTEALKAKRAAGDKEPTIFTAGGSGSGKGATTDYAVQSLGLKDPLIYDSVLGSVKSASSKIDEALRLTEGDVVIAYTNTALERAMVQNAFRKRSVSAEVLTDAHAGAAKTIKELAEKYKDNPRVKIKVMNTQSGKPEDGTVADVPDYNREEAVQRLLPIIETLHKEGFAQFGRPDLGKLSDEKYKGILGLLHKE
jgi:hypothetical protein